MAGHRLVRIGGVARQLVPAAGGTLLLDPLDQPDAAAPREEEALHEGGSPLGSHLHHHARPLGADVLLRDLEAHNDRTWFKANQDRYIEDVREKLTTPEVNDLRQLTKTVLSVFEFKKAKSDTMRVINILDNGKLDIFERRKPAGLESGDGVGAERPHLGCVGIDLNGEP